MADIKTLLERARHHSPTAPFDLGDIGRLRTRRERRRRIGATAVGLGLTTVIVVGALMGLRTSPTDDAGRGPGADAAPARRGTPGVGPGQFSYQRIRYESACQGCGSTIVHLEAWWAPDDSGRIEVIEERNYGIDGGRFGPGEFPDEGDLSEFPTEPAALEAFLLERSGSGGASPRPDVTPAPDVPLEEGQVWLAIRDFLGSTQYLNVTPELRVAMLQVLAEIPMVSVETGSTDPLGRPATAMRFHAYDAEIEVFTDPSTGDFLAMTERFDDQTETSLVVEAAGVTTDDRSTPEGDQQTVAPPS